MGFLRIPAGAAENANDFSDFQTGSGDPDGFFPAWGGIIENSRGRTRPRSLL
jgi:hypothetical protein